MEACHLAPAHTSSVEVCHLAPYRHNTEVLLNQAIWANWPPIGLAMVRGASIPSKHIASCASRVRGPRALVIILSGRLRIGVGKVLHAVNLLSSATLRGAAVADAGASARSARRCTRLADSLGCCCRCGSAACQEKAPVTVCLKPLPRSSRLNCRNLLSRARPRFVFSTASERGQWSA